MPETKHALQSKTFLTALVGIASGVITLIYGFNIPPELQGSIVIAISIIFGYLRTITDSPVYFTRSNCDNRAMPKNARRAMAVVEADRGMNDNT